MGFLFRAAVVIGAVYALSPLRDADAPLVPPAAREGLAAGARQAAGAAMALCRGNPAACLQAASALEPARPQAEAPAVRRVPALPKSPERMPERVPRARGALYENATP